MHVYIYRYIDRYIFFELFVLWFEKAYPGWAAEILLPGELLSLDADIPEASQWEGMCCKVSDDALVEWV